MFAASSHSPHIGILDSGLGGLSVLREIRQLLPHAQLSYLADSAHCPYGVKPEAFIRERVFELSDFLLSQGAQLLVIACNSATIVAVEALRTSYPVPIVGMEPAIKPAAEQSQSGIIGVLATEASLAGEKYHRLVSTHGQGLRLITRAAPEFVELVEAGQLHGQAVEQAIALHLQPLLQAGADVLVLGCTHYPFLRPAIENYLNQACPEQAISVLDTGAAVAAQVLRRLDLPALNTAPQAKQKPLFQAFTSAQPSPKLQQLITQLAAEAPRQLQALAEIRTDTRTQT